MSSSKSKDPERAESDTKNLKTPPKTIPADDDLPFDDDANLPLPPDGGWGWVVAIACKFGCRLVAIVGSVIASAAFVISAFSTSIVMMQLTYGVMGGVGFGLMYLPSIVMVGHYFDKKRALATGIAVCGSGTGTFVFAPLGSFLVREYGWKGCNIIMAAIILNGIAFGAIYRPLEHNEPKRRSKSTIMETIAAEKKRTRQMSIGSTNGVVITSDNEVIVVNNNGDGGDASKPQNNLLLVVRDGSASAAGSRASINSLKRRELAKPFARSDVLYTGSVKNLAEYKTANEDMTAYVHSIISLPQQGESRWKRSLKVVLEMFDFSLLKSATFLVLCASGTLVFLGLYTPFVYVSQKAITQLGEDPAKASLILSVLGVCNTVSRILAGWLADRRWIDLLIIHNVSAILAGAATALVSILNSYELLCLYAAFFGVNIAAFIALRSIVFVEMLGLKKLNNAFGLTSLFQGIAVLIGSPMSGALLEATGSYATSFVVCGVIISIGGIICLPVRRIANWEKEREERKKQAKTIYKKVNTKEMR